MRKYFYTIFLIAILLILSIVPMLAADSATLSIVPDQTEITTDGSATKITYTVTVTPPQGQEIGVFSFRLKPSGNMTLPDSFKVDGERVISYGSPELEYDQNEGTGVFNTYEYTPSGNFFAAVGSTEGSRMTDEAIVLTITATVPAGSTGAYLLDAEFIAAPDGSGQTYAAKVTTMPVLITDPNGGNTSGSTVIISDLDDPMPGEKPDTDITVTSGEDDIEEHTTWYRDGEEMTDGTFEPGHVYTVVTRVETGGTFDTEVYTNDGYTVNRISDTELELRRDFYVEETYTQELTKEEAQQQIDAAAQAEEPVETEESVEEAPAAKHTWLLPTVLCAAAVIAVILIPVLRKKKHADAV